MELPRGRRRRDSAAFAEFVQARSRSLHRTAYLLVGRRGLAEDLVQETLVKTYVAWPRLREPAALDAYVRRTMTTTAISWSRRKSWGETPVEEMPDRGAAGDAELLGERDLVWSAVLDLPARQRATLVLRFYEELSVARTAEVLGCAPGTVKSQLSAALSALRDRLTAHYPELVDQLVAELTHGAENGLETTGGTR